jgi:hypothetical protein
MDLQSITLFYCILGILCIGVDTSGLCDVQIEDIHKAVIA